MTIPMGTIVVWQGAVATIPAGWQVCDGTNGTYDVRGKFILGASIDADLGVTGGANAHTHSSGSTESTDNAHTHSISASTSQASTMVGKSGATWNVPTYDHGHTWSGTTGSGGGVHSHGLDGTNSISNIPPYLRYYLIKKVT